MLEVLKTNMSTIITTFQDLVKSTRVLFHALALPVLGDAPELRIRILMVFPVQIGNADASDDEDGDEAGDIGMFDQMQRWPAH